MALDYVETRGGRRYFRLVLDPFLALCCGQKAVRYVLPVTTSKERTKKNNPESSLLPFLMLISFGNSAWLLCSELFEGVHTLTPEDAQLLGLVDEVAGGGPVRSRREIMAEKANGEGKKQ